MVERDAVPGTIPEPGEIWRPVGTTHTVLTAHVVRVAQVASLVPPGLEIVRVAPGRTLASTLLTYYGPGSTLVYNELVVACALVRCGGATGFFVSHIYVDSEPSVIGGRRMGLPKEMATFEWQGGAPGVTTVRQAGAALCTIRHGRPALALPLTLRGGSVSVLDSGEVAHFGSRIQGRWGFARVDIDVPTASPIAAVGLGRPLVSLACGPMTGAMGLGFRVVGRVGPRAEPLLPVLATAS